MLTGEGADPAGGGRARWERFLGTASLLVLLLWAAGCAGQRGEPGIADARMVGGIQPGVTSKAEVVHRIGPPGQVRFLGADRETWSYLYRLGGTGSGVGDGEADSIGLMVEFGAEGRVTRVTSDAYRNDADRMELVRSSTRTAVDSARRP